MRSGIAGRDHQPQAAQKLNAYGRLFLIIQTGGAGTAGVYICLCYISCNIRTKPVVRRESVLHNTVLYGKPVLAMKKTNSIKGMVFDIQKFSVHDGPGIRTTVFLKGCSLNCLWCHNPESKDESAEISFIPDKCILCGACVAACRKGCHSIRDRLHGYDRSACISCGACAALCHAGALEVIGKEMTVDDVLAEVLKDMPFYEVSGGGKQTSQMS